MDSNDSEKPVVRKPRRGCVGIGWWVEIPVTLLIVLVLAGICMPNEFMWGKSDFYTL